MSMLIVAALCVGEPAAAATKVRVYNPYDDSGEIRGDLRTTARRGECWTGSLASSRLDAWRCAARLIYDPCFEDPASQLVVCPQTPWDRRVTVLYPVTFGERGERGGYFPWAVKLSSGTRCFFVTGASGVVRGRRLNYSCGPRFGAPYLFLFGMPDRARSTWRIWLAKSPDGRGWRRVSLAEAWR